MGHILLLFLTSDAELEFKLTPFQHLFFLLELPRVAHSSAKAITRNLADPRETLHGTPPSCTCSIDQSISTDVANGRTSSSTVVECEHISSWINLMGFLLQLYKQHTVTSANYEFPKERTHVGQTFFICPNSHMKHTPCGLPSTL